MGGVSLRVHLLVWNDNAFIDESLDVGLFRDGARVESSELLLIYMELLAN